MTTKDAIRAKAEIRRLASQLSITAIAHYDLLPRFVYNPDYDILWSMCECATQSHGKKNCPLGKTWDKKPCPTCKGVKPKGAMYCPECVAEMDRVLWARAEKVKELKLEGQRGLL